jgi:O-antigen ligase
MSDTEITYLVGACAGAFGLIAYVSLILVPAWNSYSRLWERAAAAFLSLYVVAAMAGIGVGGGLLIVYYWDRL